MASCSVPKYRSFRMEWDISIKSVAQEFCDEDLLKGKSVEALSEQMLDKVRNVLLRVVEFPRKQAFLEEDLFLYSLEELPSALKKAIATHATQGGYFEEQTPKIEEIFKRLDADFEKLYRHYEKCVDKSKKLLSEYTENFNSPGFFSALGRIQSNQLSISHGRIKHLKVDPLILKGFKSDFVHHIALQRYNYINKIDSFSDQPVMNITVSSFKQIIIDLQTEFPELSLINIEFDLRRALAAKHAQSFRKIAELYKNPHSPEFKTILNHILEQYEARHGIKVKELFHSHEKTLLQLSDLKNQMLLMHKYLANNHRKLEQSGFLTDEKGIRVLSNPDPETLMLLREYVEKGNVYRKMEEAHKKLSKQIEVVNFITQIAMNHCDKISGFYSQLAIPMRQIPGLLSEDLQHEYRTRLFYAMEKIIGPLPIYTPLSSVD